MSPQRNSTNPRGLQVEVHDAWPRRELGQTRHRNEISTSSSGATVDTVDQKLTVVDFIQQQIILRWNIFISIISGVNLINYQTFLL